MKKKYEAIIIGSGLGGLSAAAALARRGLPVLLLEQHTQPGGYATTFCRDRFEFEVSLHALTGIGTPEKRGPLFLDLEALDVARRVEFITMNDFFRSVGPDWDFTLPTGVSAYKEALIARFPDEARGIENLVRQVLTIGYEVDMIRAGSYSTAPLPTLVRFPNLVHAAGVPLSYLLDRELSSPAAKMAFAQIWSYFGLPPSKLSLLMFAVGLNMHLLYGSGTIKGKSQSLSNAFVDVIRESGGKVTFATTVNRILSENGRVSGVETAEGEQFLSDTIISNAPPLDTLNKVSDPNLVPVMLRRRLQKTPPSLSSVNLYLGLSKPSQTLGIEDYEVCINSEMDLERQYQDCLSLSPPSNVTLCAYDVANPYAAPAGAGMVTITALSDARLWEELHPHAYINTKNRMTEWMLQAASRFFPRLSGAIETISLSTPITNMRYTSNPGGAIYGFANTTLQNPGFRLENKSPIPGLYWAGAWTRPGGGFQTVISSGIITAKLVIEEKIATGVAIQPASESLRVLQEKPPASATRKFRGLGLILKDAKQVKTTLRAKYSKEKADADSPSPAIREIVHRFHAEKLPVVLKERWEETADTVTLRFTPLSGSLPPFVSGQYFSLHILRNGAETNRAYSASSPASERAYIDFTVKSRPDGDVSRHLSQGLAVGDHVQLTGPFGDFSYNPFRDAPHLVGIAAGSGITPFMSMLADAEQGCRPEKMTLFFGSRSQEDAIFHHRLMKLVQRHDWLTIVPVLSRPPADWRGETGRIDIALIRRHLPDRLLHQAGFFLCAQRSLYRTMTRALIAAGVEPSRIRIEAFGPPADITQEARWPESVGGGDVFWIRLPGMAKPIHAPAGTPLLHSLERAGFKPPGHCRSGVCDACKMELVSGNVFVPENIDGTQRNSTNKRIHTCMSYPLSDLSLLD